MEGLDELRLDLGLDRLQVPHINTSFKSFGSEEREILVMWTKLSSRSTIMGKSLLPLN